MAITVDDLLEKVKIRASIPTYQTAYSDTRLIGIINGEITSVIVPLLVNSAAEHLVTYKDFDVPANGEYVVIPPRAVGNILREVVITDPTNINSAINLGQVTVQDLGTNYTGGYYRGNWYGRPSFYITRNRLFILNSTNFAAGCKLRLYFYQRPNALVESDQVATITAIDYTTVADVPYYDSNDTERYLKVTVDAIPTLPSPWTGAEALDIVQGCSPYEQVLENATPAGIVSNDIFFDGVEMPEGVEAGDFVSLQGKSSVATIPEEVQDLLCQSVVLRVMESLGDEKGYKIAASKFNDLKNDAINLLSPRVKGEPRKVNTIDCFL